MTLKQCWKTQESFDAWYQSSIDHINRVAGPFDTHDKQRFSKCIQTSDILTITERAGGLNDLPYPIGNSGPNHWYTASSMVAWMDVQRRRLEPVWNAERLEAECKAAAKQAKLYAAEKSKQVREAKAAARDLAINERREAARIERERVHAARLAREALALEREQLCLARTIEREQARVERERKLIHSSSTLESPEVKSLRAVYRAEQQRLEGINAKIRSLTVQRDAYQADLSRLEQAIATASGIPDPVTPPDACALAFEAERDELLGLPADSGPQE